MKTLLFLLAILSAPIMAGAQSLQEQTTEELRKLGADKKPQTGKRYIVRNSRPVLEYNRLYNGEIFKVLDTEAGSYRIELQSSGEKKSVAAWVLDEALQNRAIDDYYGELETKIAEEPDPPGYFLSRKKRFRPDGHFVVRWRPPDNPRETYTYEEGRYNGVDYRVYHSDGSANFGRRKENEHSILGLRLYQDIIGWNIRCEQDKMNDRRYCLAHNADLRVDLSDDGFTSVRIGSDHYPGSTIAIRFGKEQPIVVSKDGWWGEKARGLIERLMKSDKATTRYRKWPQGYNIDGEIELFGLKEAYEYMRFAVTQPYGGSFKKRPTTETVKPKAGEMKPEAKRRPPKDGI